MDDPFDLNRFVEAQAEVFDTALGELRRGRKRTHWIWFVLPQLRGLGSSAMATRYGIGSLDEARAYLAHPELGPRLLACIAAMDAHVGSDPEVVLGSTDAQKFHSCLTLFARVSGSDSVFRQALAFHFGGQEDPGTVALLAGSA